jgi:16S rRNA A1518/A1519 N6-dimethyltransferase RsmA/KsgA/DIM1 with predicted DNA glycosylase/AP lyase activity
VESAVVVGETLPRRLDARGEEELRRLVQAGFRERRKMLHNVLPRQLPEVGRERFAAALGRVGIDPDRRPQTVSVEEWLALSAQLGPIDGTRR